MIHAILIPFDAPHSLTLVFASCKHHKNISLVICFLWSTCFENLVCDLTWVLRNQSDTEEWARTHGQFEPDPENRGHGLK